MTLIVGNTFHKLLILMQEYFLLIGIITFMTINKQKPQCPWSHDLRSKNLFGETGIEQVDMSCFDLINFRQNCTTLLLHVLNLNDMYRMAAKNQVGELIIHNQSEMKTNVKLGKPVLDKFSDVKIYLTFLNYNFFSAYL